MFVFTLVQSRTDVDTVHSVLQGLTSSRHICLSHTMKVLGWHVTSVRRSSVQVVIWISIYVEIKVWSLTYVVKCQKSVCTVHELKCHELVHSNYKQFCCGLCGKDFKRKRSVMEHFKRCSTNL